MLLRLSLALIGAVAMSVASVAKAEAATYYLSPSGSDSRSCTSTSPCRTLNRANALASAGTVVHVAPGSYPPARLTKSGTSSGRIVYRSTSKYGAKISGCQTTILELTGSYTDVVGFDVTGCGASTWNGIGLAGSFTRAIGNRVHHIARECKPNGAIVTYTGTDQQVIGNYVHDVGVGADNSCELYHGVYLSRPRNKAINNLVVRALGNGIESYHAATSLTIVNNTVVDVGTNGVVLAAPSGSSNTNSYVINNIASGNYRNYRENNQATGNHFWNNIDHSARASRAIRSSDQSGWLTTNPLFISSSDFHLQSGSPAVNTGRPDWRVPITDFDGKTRVSPPDRGAYER